MMPSLPPSTSLGPVALTVADLERSLAFYTETLGFQLQQRENLVAHLGAGEKDLLILHEQPGAHPAPRRSTGLYHFAILLPSRRQLALAIQNLVTTRTPLQGVADHFVSEAVYLSDPDGNGIEIYRDRPREQWPYQGEQIQIGTASLDLDGVMAEIEGQSDDWQGLPPETTVGHVHLQVPYLDQAEQFYRTLLGFDLMMHYGDAAAFLSAGGYHHHIGLNTWAGVGAPPPPAGSAGLRHYTILLPDSVTLDQVLARLHAAGYGFQTTDAGVFVNDPGHNGITLATASA